MVFQSSSQVVIVDRVNATSVVVGENDDVANAVVTPDGRFVAFDARPDGTGPRQVFVRDLTTGETTLVSAGENPSISDDGRFVAFESAEPKSVLVRDLSSDAIRSVDGDALHPAISGNGQFVAIETRPASGFSQVVLWNRINGQRTAVSGGAADGPSGAPSLSFDGRFVAFESRATNLTSAPAAGESNVFVRDVLTGALIPASVSLTPTLPPNGDSRRPTISGDGRRVAFESTATNLTPDAVEPGGSNVFVRDLSTETTELVTDEPEETVEVANPPVTGLTTSTPVPPPAALPPPGDVAPPPVTPAAPAIVTAPPTPPTGISSGLVTGTPVPPTGVTSGGVTSTPVLPGGTTGGLSTSTPIPPTGLATPLGTGTPVPPPPLGIPPAATVTDVASAVPHGSLRPRISPDGAWVVFESRGGIVLVNLGTGKVTTIAVTR